MGSSSGRQRPATGAGICAPEGAIARTPGGERAKMVRREGIEPSTY
jgi:hypothetical protein